MIWSLLQDMKIGYESTMLILALASICILLSITGATISISFETTAMATNSSTNSIASETGSSIYMISTRNNTDYVAVSGSGYGNAYNFSNLTKLYEACPHELVIFVHGWGNNDSLAKERLDRVKLSLEKSNYSYPLVGLSWYSNTLWEPAKIIAKENGPMLAHFILDLKERCPDTQIRLLAHSLGARVILSTLDSLHENPIWNSNNFTILSVHLLGAAVDDEEVSKDNLDIVSDPMNAYSVKAAYGQPIEDEVNKFYNLRSSEDNLLELYPFRPFDFAYKIYPIFEGDQALGQAGYQKIPPISLPANYNEKDVKDEIKAIGNADAMESDDFTLCNDNISIDIFCQVKKDGWDSGLCNALGFCRVNTGDNHAGYIGFRNLDTTSLLADDGAVDVVVRDWMTNNTAPSSSSQS
jgi:pimeloyl-ACP methyl ester carboxylesterase